MAAFALGIGMIFSSMTTKYKDMAMLLTFGVQLFMYATPVIYPLSTIDEKYRYLVEMNPLTAIIENFRYGFLGVGSLHIPALGYSFVVISILLAIGTIIFNRVQKGFMDTI